jgi:hypothetical protein
VTYTGGGGKWSVGGGGRNNTHDTGTAYLYSVAVPLKQDTSIDITEALTKKFINP